MKDTIAKKTGWVLGVLAAVIGMISSGPLPALETGTRLEQGKQLSMSRKKGNCLACHAFDDGVLPGNIGPPLVSMQLRFPDREILRAQIADAAQRNPETRMPPFGRHGILTNEEIDLIVDYIHTL